jgi:hypothetical protein
MLLSTITPYTYAHGNPYPYDCLDLSTSSTFPDVLNGVKKQGNRWQEANRRSLHLNTLTAYRTADNKPRDLTNQ